MNKFDIEFWNGILKGVFLAKEKIKETSKRVEADHATIELVLQEINTLEEGLENIHTNGIKEQLDKVRDGL